MSTQPSLAQAAPVTRPLPVLPPNARAGLAPRFGYVGQPETAPPGVPVPTPTAQRAADVRAAMHAAHTALVAGQAAVQEAISAVARLEDRLLDQDAPPELVRTACRHAEGWARAEMAGLDAMWVALRALKAHARAQRELIDGEATR